MINDPAVEETIEAQTDCRHHWVIESAQGATSWGFCKHCRATREFSNSCPGVIWEDDHVAPETLRSAPTYSLWWERFPRLSLASEGTENGGTDACEPALDRRRPPREISRRKAW